MAANAGAIRAGRAFVEIFGEDSKLQRVLDRVEKRMKGFGSILGRIGGTLTAGATAIIGPLTAAVHGFNEAGDALDKAAGRTGASVEALSELSFAAGQSGADLGAVEAGLRGMARFSLNASRGLSEATDTLSDLGISMSDIEGLTPDAQMAVFADALAKIEDPTRRAALAMKVFGKSGTTLLPMFADGAAGIEALRQEARDLGIVMSTEDSKAAAALNDAFGRVTAQMKQAAILIGAAVAPVFLKLADYAKLIAKEVIDWIDANRGLIQTVFLVAAGVGAAGAAILTLSGVFYGLAFAIGAAGSVLGVLAAGLGALFSPVGLTVAAIVALGAAWLTTTESGAQALATLKTIFGQLASDASATFGAIKTALAGGDIAAAARVLWAALKMEWTKGVEALNQEWLIFANGVEIAFENVSNRIQLIVGKMVAGVQKAILSAIGIVAKAAAVIDNTFHLGISEQIDSVLNKARQAVKDFDAGGPDKDAKRRAQREKEFEGALTESDEAIRAAISEWQSAIAAAEAVPALGGTDAETQADRVARAAAGGLEKISTAGSFSGNVRQFEGGSAIPQKQLDELQRMSGLLEDIADKESATFE